MGATVQHPSVSSVGEDLAGLAASFLREFPAEVYPDLAERIRQHL